MHTPIPASTLEKFITFGDLLRFLRRHAGLTQMELAIAVGYSESQISRLEQNQRLPDIITIEARFVSALGLEEEPKAVARLLDLAANVRRDDAPAAGLSPYKGLNYFDESDSDLFVGREELTSKLTNRILLMATSGASQNMHFLAIVGASGSGKSSLVRAGLVSSLRWNKVSANWHIHILTPNVHPLESLATSLTQESISVTAATMLADDLQRDPRSLQIFVRRKMGLDSTSPVLLVVDQFEELFSLCRSEKERAAFIDNLLTAACDEGGTVMIVITIRADFYTYCASYPQLREALSTNQEYIGAMNTKELRRAIEEPAQRGRWELEPGLVDLLLHEVGHEPGALPLLSHALLETWQRRRGRTMTLSGYTASGGVRGAIAETAEAVFADQFTQEQQAIARRIFLRLTELGDEAGAGDTRRRATFNELIAKPEEATSTQAVLKALADARLIITSENSAEVAHEALIREWPTLHGWLEENREWLRLHRQLTEAAIEWRRADHAPDMLFRGARLTQLREWAEIHEDEMNTLEQEFLDASQAWTEKEAAERETQRQRELASVQTLADTQRHAARQLRRRAYFLVSALALTAITAVIAGIFASRNATLAGQNLIIARTAQAANMQSIASFKLSEAQRLAAEANNLLLNNGDTNLIALLSILSLKTKYTPMGDAMLSSLTTFERPPRELKGHTADIWNVDFSPDGKYLATASDDKTARLWDLASGQTIRIFSGFEAALESIKFSPDGKYLLVGSMDHTAYLIDIASGQTVQTFSGHSGGVDWVDFSPDGKRIITAGGDDKTAHIWDVASGQTLFILKSNADYLPRVAFSPDGKYVFTDRLWDAATGEAIQSFPEQAGAVSCVAFSPDSKYVATGSDDGIARVWNVSTGQMVHEFTGHQGFINGIKFSPDSKFLLTGGADQTARLWNVNTGQTIHIFSGHAGGVQGVTFSPDGKRIATSSNDGIARVWDLQTDPTGQQFIGHTAGVWQASFSPNGKEIVTAGADRTARIWDRETGQTKVIIKGHTSEVRGAVFSPDGKYILTSSADQTARLWDAVTGQEVRRFEGHTDIVNRAVFSPDGKYIVTTSYDGTAQVWDSQTAKTIVIYRSQGPEHLNRVAFSPDGKTVATSGDDGTVHIWDPFTGKERQVFKQNAHMVGLAFSPDGRHLVTCIYDGSVRLWDIASGQEVRRFTGHTVTAFGAAFSPDGKYILTSGRDGTARLWDMEAGDEVRRFVGHKDEVRDVAFSPDGRYILTASFDGTARLWLTSLDDTINAVCASATRDFTSEEKIQFNIPDQNPTCSAQ